MHLVQSTFSTTCATALEFSYLIIELNEISLTSALRRFNLVSSTFNYRDLLFLQTIHTLSYSTHVLCISCGLTSPIDLRNSFLANAALTKAMVALGLFF